MIALNKFGILLYLENFRQFFPAWQTTCILVTVNQILKQFDKLTGWKTLRFHTNISYLNQF